MLNALFSLFFTPINKELLFNDIFKNKFITDDTELTPEDIEIEYQLSNPEGFYYQRKTEEDK